MKKYYLFLASLLFSIYTYSQTLDPQVIASSGNYFASANIKLNWTLGEMVTETFVSSGKILTQGFHQSNYLYTSISASTEDKEISIYPNPFLDVIVINTGNYTGLFLQVYDLQGKILIEKNIRKSNFQLDLSAFSSGTYFIKIYSDEKTIKTIKIQKNKN